MIPDFPRLVHRDHRNYANLEIDDILDFLGRPKLPWGALTEMSKATGIPDSTLSEWHKKRRQPGNEKWFPLRDGHPGKRVFTFETEQAIFEYVNSNLIENGIGATRNDLKTAAKNAFSSLPVEKMRAKRVCASNRFISHFEERWKLSLRTPHRERRPLIDNIYVNYFLKTLRQITTDYPPERIFNLDETSWKLFMSPAKVLAEKGTETVKLASQQGEKETITAFGGISADGTKLPLWIIAKGKTARCERKFGNAPGLVFRHSPSGWATDNLLVEYLRWLHTDVCHGEPCALVLDVFASHRTERVWQTAFENDVELLYVPAGGTGKYQPLDRRIFGELKSRARSEFDRLWGMNGLRGADHRQTMTVLINCWTAISSENVRKSWEIPGLVTVQTAPTVILNQMEEVVMRAISSLSEDDRPYVSLRRIIRYLMDFGDIPDDVNQGQLVKKAALNLKKEKIIKAKKESWAFTKFGKRLVQTHNQQPID